MHSHMYTDDCLWVRSEVRPRNDPVRSLLLMWDRCLKCLDVAQMWFHLSVSVCFWC